MQFIVDTKGLLQLINNAFKKTDFIKARNKEWLLDRQDVVFILRFRTSLWEKQFYLDFGCIYKELNPKPSLKDYTIDDSHISHTIYNVLLFLKKSSGLVEKLFSYAGPDEQTKDNIDDLFSILEQEVLPFIVKFGDYHYMIQNFQKNIAFKPFFIYFESIEFYLEYFRKKSQTSGNTDTNK